MATALQHESSILEDELTPLPMPGDPLLPFPRPEQEPAWSLLKNREVDFDGWLRCPGCFAHMEMPKTLHCMHTICLRCLYKRYRTSIAKAEAIEERKKQKSTAFEDEYDFWEYDGLFSCPVCAFPCYIPPDVRPSDYPTNVKFLRASYKERVLWWHEHCQKVIEYEAEIMAKSPGKENTMSKIKRWFSSFRCKGKEDPVQTCPDARTAIDTQERKSLLDKGEVMGAHEVAKQSHIDKDMTIDPDCSDFRIKREAFKSGPEVVESLIKKYGRRKVEDIVASTVHSYTPKDVDEALTKHWNIVLKACPGQSVDTIFRDDDAPNLGSVGVKKLGEFEVRHHHWDREPMFATAIAVSSHTGHIVVVDSSMNRTILFKNKHTPFGMKQFEHSIIAVAFYPPSSGLESFCAVGHAQDKRGIYVYKAPFNNNPDDYFGRLQHNVRDICGLLVIEKTFLCLATPDTHKVLRQINDYQFTVLASRREHGLCHPTHMIHTAEKEIIFSDTGNHRIAKFYGPDYAAYDFYGTFGSDHGEFYHPQGIAMDDRRHLYVCDSSNYRVQVFVGFLFEDCPIRRTYLLGKSVKQDVKPVDCGINNKQNLVVLFRGRHYASLMIYKYNEPLVVFNANNPSPIKMEDPCCCMSCILCCSPCCRRNTEEIIQRGDYQSI